MLGYFIRRLFLAAVTIWAITVVSFVIIQLPPGDFVDAYVAQSAAMGSAITMEEAAALRQAYGLDEPLLVQYFKWLSLISRGEFGVSFEFGWDAWLWLVKEARISFKKSSACRSILTVFSSS